MKPGFAKSMTRNPSKASFLGTFKGPVVLRLWISWFGFVNVFDVVIADEKTISVVNFDNNYYSKKMKNKTNPSDHNSTSTVSNPSTGREIGTLRFGVFFFILANFKCFNEMYKFWGFSWFSESQIHLETKNEQIFQTFFFSKSCTFLSCLSNFDSSLQLSAALAPVGYRE